MSTGNLKVAATLTPVLLKGKLALTKLLVVNDDFWAIPSIPLFQREVEGACPSDESHARGMRGEGALWGLGSTPQRPAVGVKAAPEPCFLSGVSFVFSTLGICFSMLKKTQAQDL